MGKPKMKTNAPDRYDRIAAYSRVLAAMSDLLDREANETISLESPAIEKLGEVYDSMVEARDLI